MIRFDNADIRFSESFSLGQVSWQINKGQCWVVTGPNGSGKSALVATLAGEGELRSGQLDLGEADVAVVSLEAFLQAMPQNARQHPKKQKTQCVYEPWNAAQ